MASGFALRESKEAHAKARRREGRQAVW